MIRRTVHYEAAFADFLRGRGVPHVPVDQAKRAIFAGARIKSFDLLVYPPSGLNWLVDVKGRKFPYVTRDGAKRYWENWVTDADEESLAEWQQVFGDEFEARFVFAYLLGGPPDRWPPVTPHVFRGQQYAFLSVRLDDYVENARRRSPRWGTVSIPTATFRRIAHPVTMASPSSNEPQRAAAAGPV